MVLNRIANMVWWYIQTGKTEKGDFGGNQIHLHYNKTFPAVRALMLEKATLLHHSLLFTWECHPHLFQCPGTAVCQLQRITCSFKSADEYVLLLFLWASHLRSLHSNEGVFLCIQRVFLWWEWAVWSLKTDCQHWVGLIHFIWATKCPGLIY